MQDRAIDWLEQAQDDFRWGTASAESGFYSQTCFIAQQVAGKSLKALAYSRDAALVRGHSVFMVCRELKINGALEEAARRLDQSYIPTRYPDAQPAGAPFRYFTEKQAKEALELAQQFIEKAGSEIAEDSS
jgi:HEPN domain-containing protein